MRLSEEQEASASQVVRNWEDKKGHDGHKLSCSSVPDEIIDEVLNLLHSLGRSLSDAECVLKISIQTTTNPLEFLISTTVLIRSSHEKYYLVQFRHILFAISSMSRRIYL